MSAVKRQVEYLLAEFGPRCPVEVAVRGFGATQHTRTFRGRLLGYVGGRVRVLVAGRDRGYADETVRYVSAVDEEAHTRSLRPGERVAILKYGNTYEGTVVKAYTKRVDVAILLRRGESKTVRVSGIDAARVTA